MIVGLCQDGFIFVTFLSNSNREERLVISGSLQDSNMQRLCSNLLKVCARFAEGFDIVQLGRCQEPESRFWQNRAQASRKLMRQLGLPEPPHAHAPPHVLFDSQHYSTLSCSTLGSYISFLSTLIACDM